MRNTKGGGGRGGDEEEEKDVEIKTDDLKNAAGMERRGKGRWNEG